MAKPDIVRRMTTDVLVDIDSVFWKMLPATDLSDPLALMLHLEQEAEAIGSTLEAQLQEWYGDYGRVRSRHYPLNFER
jgi:hypothetical protein